MPRDYGKVPHRSIVSNHLFQVALFAEIIELVNDIIGNGNSFWDMAHLQQLNLKNISVGIRTCMYT